MWKRHWKLAVLVLVLAVQAVAIAVLWGQVDGLRADLADSREGAADLEAQLEAADEALQELQAAQAQQPVRPQSPAVRGFFTLIAPPSVLRF